MISANRISVSAGFVEVLFSEYEQWVVSDDDEQIFDWLGFLNGNPHFECRAAFKRFFRKDLKRFQFRTITPAGVEGLDDNFICFNTVLGLAGFPGVEGFFKGSPSGGGGGEVFGFGRAAAAEARQAEQDSGKQYHSSGPAVRQRCFRRIRHGHHFRGFPES